MANTETGTYAFTVKDGYPGSAGGMVPPAIMLETRDKDLQVLAGGFLMLNLRKGLDENQARELAQLLGKYVENVSYTSR